MPMKKIIQIHTTDVEDIVSVAVLDLNGRNMNALNVPLSAIYDIVKHNL
jgi:hypothetical protein